MQTLHKPKANPSLQPQTQLSPLQPAAKPAPPRQLETLLQAEPDLVDRIFDYILSDPVLAAAINKEASAEKTTLQKLKANVRAEFRGEECYIAGRPATARQEQVSQVLALFNGRNASEVARRLQIGRATVYRYLKQAGKARKPDNQPKPSQFSGK